MVPDKRDDDDEGGDGDGDSVDAFLRRVAHVSDQSLLVAALEAKTEVAADTSLPAVGVPELPVVPRESYVVVTEYARGGMGRVLVARDQRLGRRVAVKELLKDHEHARERFVREALITARLEHPGIVPVHEAGRWPSGEPFYAMKLVAGRPLSLVIDETPALDGRLALVPVVLAVAEAMAYAHSQRVIHRDLKPDNVLVGELGETVVIDWGLARHLDEAERLTVVGAVVGTPGFMAPEQAAGEEATERADVYALGALLYTLLAGGPPYRGRTAAQVIERTLRGPPTPLEERQPEVPVELLAIVNRAMARQPGERYADAKELAVALRAFTTRQLLGAHRHPLFERMGRLIAGHRLATALVSLVFLSVASAGLWLAGELRHELRRRGDERAQAVARATAAESARAHELMAHDHAILAAARATVAGDATATLARLKQLSPDSPLWRDARAIAVAAAAQPIAAATYPGRLAGFAPDGTLATVDDGQVYLSTSKGSPVSLGAVAGVPAALAFSRDGQHLAVATGAELHAYDVARRLARPVRIDGGARAVAIRDDGSILAAGDTLRASDRWGRAVSPSASAASTAIDAGAAVALCSDGSRALVGNAHQTSLVELGSGHTRRVGGGATAVAFDPACARFVSCGADGTITVRSLEGKSTRYRNDAAVPCRALALASDGTVAAATGTTVRLWRAPEQPPRRFDHATPVEHVALAPDGTRLICGGAGAPLRLWRLDPLPAPPADAARLRAWLDTATTLAFDDEDLLR